VVTPKRAKLREEEKELRSLRPCVAYESRLVATKEILMECLGNDATIIDMLVACMQNDQGVVRMVMGYMKDPKVASLVSEYLVSYETVRDKAPFSGSDLGQLCLCATGGHDDVPFSITNVSEDLRLSSEEIREIRGMGLTIMNMPTVRQHLRIAKNIESYVSDGIRRGSIRVQF
jgi:hypothetical protein